MARTKNSGSAKAIVEQASRKTATTSVIVTKLQALERDLDARLIERSDSVRAAMVALLSKQHMTTLGLPGAAKSMLVTETAARFGLTKFVWLMSKFTTPEELFGPISVKGLKNDEYRRITTGKLPEAELAFLDEPFKATSAILNTLLTITNEREFDNGVQHNPDGSVSASRMACPLISLFGASNEMPQGEDLAALWDRFALRMTVGYVSDSNFNRMLRIGACKTPIVTMSRAELFEAQAMAAALPVPDSLFDALGQLRKDLAATGIIASDRRWRWMPSILQGHALMEGKVSVDEDDLIMLKHAMWNKPDEEKAIGRIAARMANPVNARAVELMDKATGVFDGYTTSARGAQPAVVMNAAVEAMTKLKAIHEDLDHLLDQAKNDGRSTVRVDRSVIQVKELRATLGKILVGA
jgi:MoxR-like ATPase